MDELSLIKRIQRYGDRAAAEEIVRHYYDEIFAFVQKQVSSQDYCLDLTQEIFISLLRTISHYDPKRGASFRTWLYRIATHKLIDWYRSRSYKEQRRTIDWEDFDPPDPIDFTQQVEFSQWRERILQWLSDQPGDLQQIFRLHVFAEYSFRQISELLALRESTVKSKYYRLIQRLRKEIDINE